ncbi:MAG: hypothetical protein PHF44_00790 [Candidatus Pacebacteria bacterium]|nr:hypothetical protein [Candidatus Paceibacterota bacterium]
MKIIISSDRSAIETEGISDREKRVFVIKKWSSRGKLLTPEEESKRVEIEARKIADFLEVLPSPVYLRLANIIKKRAGVLKRRIREREDKESDMFGSLPNVSNYSRRNLERFAGVLELDRVHSWDDIIRALGLPDYAILGEMTDSLRERISHELNLSKEANWDNIASALGFSKLVPLYQILEALREKRARDLGLPKTASWAKIKKQKNIK